MLSNFLRLLLIPYQATIGRLAKLASHTTIFQFETISQACVFQFLHSTKFLLINIVNTLGTVNADRSTEKEINLPSLLQIIDNIVDIFSSLMYHLLQVLLTLLLLGALLAAAEGKRRGGKPKKARSGRVGFGITVTIINNQKQQKRHNHHYHQYHI